MITRIIGFALIIASIFVSYFLLQYNTIIADGVLLGGVVVGATLLFKRR
jgi:hypothetical protein